MPKVPASLPARRPRPRGPIAIAAAMLLASAAAGEALEPDDILVTDFLAHKLYAIHPETGVPTELASAGFLLNPVGVAVRADGFAFLTNIGSQLFVRIDPAAISPTPVQVAISAFANARGIVIDPSGDAFVSSPNTGEIIRVDTVTGTGSPASASGVIPFPTGLVREASGDLVVADSSTLGSRILRIHPQDGVQTLLSSAGSFLVLRDIEIDPTAAGSFLVVDSSARKVFRVDATVPYDPLNPGANQSEWVACPQFLSPRGIAVEADGSVLVSDFTARKVFRVNPIPPRLCTALATGSTLLGPWDVTVAANLSPFAPGPLLVADAGPPDQVQQVDPAAAAGAGTGVPVPASPPFVDPVAVTRDLNGDLLVLQSDRIVRRTLGGLQTDVSVFTGMVDLTGIVVDADGEILVTDAANDRLVRVIPGTGEQIVVADDDGMPSSPLGRPAGLALDRNGTALVANRGDPLEDPVIPTGIVRVNPISGTSTGVVSNVQLDEIVAIALDTNGDYLLADEGTDTVWRFRASTPAAPLLYPVSVGNDIVSLRGIAVDVNRSILVSNQGPKKILRLDPTSGVQTAVAPAVAFTDIRGIALDQIPSPPDLDSDNDGLLEAVDNCPELANPDQLDTDNDGQGDPCDADDDGDGILDVEDNCRLLASPDQTDSNRDGFGNLCDADYDNNGGVNPVDFFMFAGAYLKSTGQPGYDAQIDANSDGVIGPSDFAVFASLYLRPPGPSGLACAGGLPGTCPP